MKNGVYFGEFWGILGAIGEAYAKVKGQQIYVNPYTRVSRGKLESV